MWVLDASILVKWFFTDEPLRANALQVQSYAIGHPHKFVIPHLCYSELVHVLTRKSQGDLEFVQRCLELIMRMGLRTLGLSRDAWLKAVELSCKGLSGYDATYLALAYDLQARWLTDDRKALKKSMSAYILTLEQWN